MNTTANSEGLLSDIGLLLGLVAALIVAVSIAWSAFLPGVVAASVLMVAYWYIRARKKRDRLYVWANSVERRLARLEQALEGIEAKMPG